MTTSANWVAETTTTTGTGTITLGGVLGIGYITAADAFVSGDNIFYHVVDNTTGDKESGTSALTFSRTLISRNPVATLVSGVYDNTSPTPINLSGDATVFIGGTAEELQDKVQLGGSTMTGPLILRGTYTNDNEAVDKLYVDNAKHFRNLMLNCEGNVNSVGNTSYIATGGETELYPGFDCWDYNSIQSNMLFSRGKIDHSVETNWPNELIHYLQLSKSTAFVTTGTPTILRQKLPSATLFAGKSYTLSFYLDLNSLTGDIKLEYYSFINNVSTFILLNTYSNETVTPNNRQEFTFTVPSIPDTVTGHLVTDYAEIRFRVGNTLPSFTVLRASGFQLEEGVSATPYKQVPFEECLSACSKFMSVYREPINLLPVDTAGVNRRAVIPLNDSMIDFDGDAPTRYGIGSTTNLATGPTLTFDTNRVIIEGTATAAASPCIINADYNNTSASLIVYKYAGNNHL